MGSNCDEAGHLIKNEQIDHSRRGFYSFSFIFLGCALLEHENTLSQ